MSHLASKSSLSSLILPYRESISFCDPGFNAYVKLRRGRKSEAEEEKY
jgi:hypothetical protein